jgi:hypothetical protein
MAEEKRTDEFLTQLAESSASLQTGDGNEDDDNGVDKEGEADKPAHKLRAGAAAGKSSQGGRRK